MGGAEVVVPRAPYSSPPIQFPPAGHRVHLLLRNADISVGFGWLFFDILGWSPSFPQRGPWFILLRAPLRRLCRGLYLRNRSPARSKDSCSANSSDEWSALLGDPFSALRILVTPLNPLKRKEKYPVLQRCTPELPNRLPTSSGFYMNSPRRVLTLQAIGPRPFPDGDGPARLWTSVDPRPFCPLSK